MGCDAQLSWEGDANGVQKFSGKLPGRKYLVGANCLWKCLGELSMEISRGASGELSEECSGGKNVLRRFPWEM